MKTKLPHLLMMTLCICSYAKNPITTSSKQFVKNEISKSSLEMTSNEYYVNMLSSKLAASNPKDDPSIEAGQYASSNAIQRVRIQFSSDDGLIRPLLLGFTPNNAASDGFDYGYDARNYDEFPNDMFWDIEGEDYVIQGVGAFNTSKKYPLHIMVANSGLIHIGLTGLENFESDIDVFVYDSVLNTYAQINNDEFEMVLDSDNYQDRFYIAFSSQSTTLSLTDSNKDSLKINYLNGTSEIYIKSADLIDIKNITLINIYGQTVMSWNKTQFNNTAGETRIALNHVLEGTYVIKVATHNATINKKAFIKN